MVHSSVARGANGAIAPPIGQKSMQNSMFFAVLRLILALKREIVPPLENSSPQNRETRCRTLDFVRKIALNFGEDLFF